MLDDSCVHTEELTFLMPGRFPGLVNEKTEPTMSRRVNSEQCCAKTQCQTKDVGGTCQWL